MKEHGPFDGVVTFSQGGILLRHMYRTIFLIDPDTYREVLSNFPKFIIAFGGPLFQWQSFQYKGVWYKEDGSLIGVDSCHMYGT